ncbi:MAG TPA: DUF1269 domain-containing protein [Pirellulales bacterium]|nr:DUF1269 domain-containing protein [Pirellulales bacterium]
MFDIQKEAEAAVHALRHAGFPQSQISLVVRHPGDSPELLEKLRVGDEPVEDSAIGAGLGGVLGFLCGIVLAEITGVGTVFLLGPLAALFVGAAVGTLLGAMAGLGVRHEHIGYYEQCVKEGKVLVIAHGDDWDLDNAYRIFHETTSAELHRHADIVPSPPKGPPLAR